VSLLPYHFEQLLLADLKVGLHHFGGLRLMPMNGSYQPNPDKCSTSAETWTIGFRFP
jgi:hypothetical protein